MDERPGADVEFNEHDETDAEESSATSNVRALEKRTERPRCKVRHLMDVTKPYRESDGVPRHGPVA